MYVHTSNRMRLPARDAPDPGTEIREQTSKNLADMKDVPETLNLFFI